MLRQGAHRFCINLGPSSKFVGAVRPTRSKLYTDEHIFGGTIQHLAAQATWDLYTLVLKTCVICMVSGLKILRFDPIV